MNEKLSILSLSLSLSVSLYSGFLNPAAAMFFSYLQRFQPLTAAI